MMTEDRLVNDWYPLKAASQRIGVAWYFPVTIMAEGPYPLAGRHDRRTRTPHTAH